MIWRNIPNINIPINDTEYKLCIIADYGSEKRGHQQCIRRAVTEILKNSCKEWWVEGGLKNFENQCNFNLSAEVNAT